MQVESKFDPGFGCKIKCAFKYELESPIYSKYLNYHALCDKIFINLIYDCITRYALIKSININVDIYSRATLIHFHGFIIIFYNGINHVFTYFFIMTLFVRCS